MSKVAGRKRIATVRIKTQMHVCQSVLTAIA
nr:MAG TPA: hypothetical protein [Caudoviricetes sp.]